MYSHRLTMHFSRRPRIGSFLQFTRYSVSSNTKKAKAGGFSATIAFTRAFRLGAENSGRNVRQGSSRRKIYGFDLRKSAAVGGSIFGLGTLSIYGLISADKDNEFNISSIIWPDYVKRRIHDTYLYFGGSLIVTALSALKAFQSPTLLMMVTRTGFLPVLASLVVLIGAQTVCTSIPYKPGLGLKQIAWLIHSMTVGAFLAPVCLIGGPILTRAAWYTAGIVGGLTVVASCAPSNTFLYMAGPLAMGLGVVVAASIGSMFFPPTGGVLRAGLYSASLYGGLLVMAAFIFYDTQRIVAAAETHLDTVGNLYDPVNMLINFN